MSDATTAEWLQEWNGRIVAVANNKGGVRKTSLVTNIGGQLAAAGQRVLIVAFDHQEDEAAACDLGYLDRSDHGASLARALLAPGQPVTVLRDVRPGLDVIADGRALEEVTKEVYGRVGRGEPYEELAYGLLHDVLAPIAHEYDLILIDCPPGARVLVDAALGVARWVLIPTASDEGSIKAMRGTAKDFVGARRFNPGLQLLGVVLTASDVRATTTRDKARERIDEIFGGGGQAPLFETFLRFQETPATRARAEGALVHELASKEVGEKREILASLASLRRTRPKRAAETAAPSAAQTPPARRAWKTNSTGLAEDYRRITAEVVRRITDTEEDA